MAEENAKKVYLVLEVEISGLNADDLLKAQKIVWKNEGIDALDIEYAIEMVLERNLPGIPIKVKQGSILHTSESYKVNLITWPKTE